MPRPSLLDRLAEQLSEHRSAVTMGRESREYPRITLRTKPGCHYDGTHYLLNVGSDYIEIANGPRGESPVLVTRSMIIEAFFG